MNLIENNETPAWAPVCEVCKTRDKTLRAVSFPFVFSIVVMTFQRAFTGVYCKKHQRIYHLLASLITSVAGWLGIPYGFVLTPMTLFKLARGGVSNVEANIQILGDVANKKLNEGDALGAIECFEESLKLKETPDVSEKLKRLYQMNRSSIGSNAINSILSFVSIPVLLGASISTGMLIGLIDLLIGYLLSPLFNETSSIIIAIISWLPTVLLMFLGVLFLRSILRWTLQTARLSSHILGYVLVFLSTTFMYYSILEGQAIIRNIQAVTSFFYTSRIDTIFALRSILSHGGIDLLLNNIDFGGLSYVIFSVLFTSGMFLSIFIGVELAGQFVRWRQRLDYLQSTLSLQQDKSAMPAWFATAAILLGVVLINGLLYPGTYVNIEATYQKWLSGLSELEQYQPAKAVKYFNDAIDSWPNSVTGHVYLGLGYSDQDKYEQALDEFNTSLEIDPNSNIAHLLKAYALAYQIRYSEAVDEFELVAVNQPGWGLPHANLALIYYLLGETDKAKREIETAIAYENEDAQTLSIIGTYFIYQLEIDRAEEYYLKAVGLTNSPSDYIFLARVYLMQGKYDDAEKVIANAEELGADPVDVYLSRISLAEFRSDLRAAKSLVTEAILAYPDNSLLYGEKSFIEFKQGQDDISATDAEKAIQLNPYNTHAYVELAFALHSQGKLAEAQKIAEKAVSLNPQYDRAHYILGLCYMDNGLKNRAILEFERFQELYWERPLMIEDKVNVDRLLKQLK